jgi:hypothetical protein
MSDRARLTDGTNGIDWERLLYFAARRGVTVWHRGPDDKLEPVRDLADAARLSGLTGDAVNRTGYQEQR